MFKRFEAGMFKPKSILDFKNDSKLITTLYYFLLVTLLVIPSIILIFINSGLSYQDRTYVKNELKDYDINYEIVDYELQGSVFEEQRVNLTTTIELIFTDKDVTTYKIDPFEIATLIIFTKTGIIYYDTVIVNLFIEYKDYPELENFDFSLVSSDDQAFWQTVFAVTNKMIRKHEQKVEVINLFISFVASAIFLAFFSVIVALIHRSKLKPYMRFSKSWQLIIYAMTPYVIISLLGNLFGFSDLLFIGVIFSYIYVNRLSLAIMEKNSRG